MASKLKRKIVRDKRKQRRNRLVLAAVVAVVAASAILAYLFLSNSGAGVPVIGRFNGAQSSSTLLITGEVCSVGSGDLIVFSPAHVLTLANVANSTSYQVTDTIVFSATLSSHGAVLSYSIVSDTHVNQGLGYCPSGQ